MASHVGVCRNVQLYAFHIYFILSSALYIKIALYRLHFKAIRKFQEMERRYCATYSRTVGQEQSRQSSKKWLWVVSYRFLNPSP